MLFWLVLYLVGCILAYGLLANARFRATRAEWRDWETTIQVGYTFLSWISVVAAIIVGARGLKYNHRAD